MVAGPDEDIKLSEEEVEYGLGPRFYPFKIIRLAYMMFESSGHIPNPEQLMELDPGYLLDFMWYRRLRVAKQQELKRLGGE